MDEFPDLPLLLNTDDRFMREALRQARRALAADEVPIGAVIVHDGHVIARAWNQVETLKDATAHAEMIALTQAQSAMGDWRLSECDLYVTKEPCPMCAGAIMHCRVRRVVFGCPDVKSGAAGGFWNLLQSPNLNHRSEITPGVLAEDCVGMLKAFFKEARERKANGIVHSKGTGKTAALVSAGRGPLKNFHVAHRRRIPFNSRMVTEQRERFWKAAARRLARRVNLGWWSEQWMTWVMSAGLLGAVALLLARWKPLVALSWVWCGVGALLVIGGIVAWLAVRRRVESPAAARIRLEDALGLHARLSAAEAGVGPWPEPVASIAWPVRWRWQKPLAVVALAALMLALAALIPISRAAQDDRHAIEKPSSVKDVEQWVEQLRKEKAADEKSLEDLEKKMTDLLQRPSENWYEHGSLEAADNLKEQTEGQLREMENNLADAERAASAMEAMGDAASPEVKQSLADGLSAASRELSSGGIKPNQQMLQDLLKAQSKAGGLTPQQRKDLAQRLRENQKALQQALSKCEGLDTSHIPIAKDGKGEKKSEGEQAGKGGEGGGKEGAPMLFKEDATDLNSKRTELTPSQIDLERIAPGDTLALTNGKHEVDKNAYTGPKQGGAIQNTGDGGSAVWQNSLVPAEREALKKYFK